MYNYLLRKNWKLNKLFKELFYRIMIYQYTYEYRASDITYLPIKGNYLAISDASCTCVG